MAFTQNLDPDNITTPARSVTGLTIALMYGPGINIVAANEVALLGIPGVLPATINILSENSLGNSYTYSVGYELV